MKVLVVGGGGREHSMTRALASSPEVDGLLVAPGNAGIEEMARCVPVAATDIPGLVELVDREDVDLTVVGPEAPLVAGLVDELEERGRLAFGPRADAARLEGSKAWARELCDAHGIPGPRSRAFTDAGEAAGYLDTLQPPYVVKADGLAAGKGVTIAPTREGAVVAIEDALVRRRFGSAGATVVLEEHLTGREVSALALTDGSAVVPLALAQDFKRAEEGDRGPNTGGMGAYSPVPFVDDETTGQIVKQALEAAVTALAAEGVTYRGVLYAGLMLTEEGPRVLEYNCRFGDPETQAVLPRLGSDLAPLLRACAESRLAGMAVEWKPQACVTVVLASGGYPGDHRVGMPIRGLERAAEQEDVAVFHAGTARRDGRVVTAGGRVLAVSALGPDVAGARRRAYEACSLIEFDGKQHRTDIAKEVSGG